MRGKLTQNIGYYTLATALICFCVTGLYRSSPQSVDFEDEIERELVKQLSLDRPKESRPAAARLTRSLNLGEEPKIILLWTNYHDVVDFHFGLGARPFTEAGCSCFNCKLTTDRKLINVSDAIIFHSIDIDPNDMPPIRHPHQIWIFYSFSQPRYHPPLPKHLLDKFNWTMTYRRDSDIYTRFPFGAVVAGKKLRKSYGISKRQMLNTKVNRPTKKKLVAWVASTCPTAVRRESYVRELTKHIPVDIYGSCGQKRCGNAEQCSTMLSRDYKFLLAFESELCTDYVSEKMFLGLEAGVVPVVYGAADLEHFAPAHSYINARDFDSPKELADFLLLLDSNPLLYEKYLTWQQDYIVDRYPTKGWCDLCQKLNTQDGPEYFQFYEDIEQWWVKDVVCQSSYNINSTAKSWLV